jgi:hypothetical protein
MNIQQIKQLIETTPNDQMLGGKIRELYWKSKGINEVKIDPNQIDLEDMINEMSQDGTK